MAYSSDRALQSNQLPISIDYPPTDSPEFLNTLSLDRKRISDSMNTKEGSLYLLEELANFQQYFSIDSSNLQRNRNGYRTTFDLVALNGGPIPPGVTVIVLTSSSQPPLINGILYPVHGFGAATIAGPIYIFINDPDLYVRFDNTVPSAQEIEITNNTGSDLIQCYWVVEYTKS